MRRNSEPPCNHYDDMIGTVTAGDLNGKPHASVATCAACVLKSPSDQTMSVIITVYTQPGCMPCRATKRILDAAGATYTQIDVTEDGAAAEQLRAEGHRQMPVVKVSLPDGVDAWSGHNVDKVKAAAWLVTEGAARHE